ncbi:hypothetical protein M3Y98_00053000 [Aphelenchoides besseyi]|nr:hypothetical protein M3Y98_00053000 [Aphelenchoides besseyi]KAI6198919.1 hypothetical protein M3Y96_00571600 [Aphelenchoides besseyi]
MSNLRLIVEIYAPFVSKQTDKSRLKRERKSRVISLLASRSLTFGILFNGKKMSFPTSADVEDGEIVSSEQEESSGAEEEPARKRRVPSKRRRTVHDFIQDDVEVDEHSVSRLRS